MSVLYDYFRAPDSDTAIEWAIGPGGDWHRHSGLDELGVDWIDAKNLDACLALGQLIAFAQGVLFDALSTEPGLLYCGRTSGAWPPGEQRPGQMSPWDEGPTLEHLPEEWVTTLAAIDDEQLYRFALQWATIEEFRFADAADAEYSASSSSAPWPGGPASTAKACIAGPLYE